MPAFGAVLLIFGLWVLLRTVRHNVPIESKEGKCNGGLVEMILGHC